METEAERLDRVMEEAEQEAREAEGRAKAVLLREWDTFEAITSAVALYKPLWWHETGLPCPRAVYGKKIPTVWMVCYQGRMRRVYCSIYSNFISSNGSTTWITVNGKRVHVT